MQTTTTDVLILQGQLNTFSVVGALRTYIGNDSPELQWCDGTTWYPIITQSYNGLTATNGILKIGGTLSENTALMLSQALSIYGENVIFSLDNSTGAINIITNSIGDEDPTSTNIAIDNDGMRVTTKVDAVEGFFKNGVEVVGSTALKRISGVGTSGLVKIGRDGLMYGIIGDEAMDLSTSNQQNSNNGATGDYSLATGLNVKASGDYSTAKGNKSEAIGEASSAEGYLTIASGPSSHAEGDRSTASGDISHAEGNQTEASGYISHAEGMGSIASGNMSHAEGSMTSASNTNAHSEGNLTKAQGANSHAEGSQSEANGTASHAEGTGTIALAENSHSEGYNTRAEGVKSHAEGHETIASGLGAHTEGKTTTASGSYSHAEGYMTVASGGYSHAEGGGTTASGFESHAEGEGSEAKGGGSHAEGNYSVADGEAAHSEGSGCKALNDAAHAEGSQTSAEGQSSHAEGDNTIAKNNGSHAAGMYNIGTSTETIHETGIGLNNADRKNAFEIYVDGKILAPEQTIALTTEPKQLTTVEYIATKIGASAEANANSLKLTPRSLPTLNASDSGTLCADINGDLNYWDGTVWHNLTV